MKRYEVALNIINEDYTDLLAMALLRQGYSVYYNEEEKKLCFSATEEEVTEIKETR